MWGVCGGRTRRVSQGRARRPRGVCVGKTLGVQGGGAHVGGRPGRVGVGWGGWPGAACSAHLCSPPFRWASSAGSARGGREVSEAPAAGSATATAAERHRSLGRRPRLEPRGRRRRCCGGKLQIPPPPPPPPLPSPSSPPPAQEGHCRRRRAGRERGGAAACPAFPSTFPTPFRLPPTCKPLPAPPAEAPVWVPTAAPGPQQPCCVGTTSVGRRSGVGSPDLRWAWAGGGLHQRVSAGTPASR